LNKLIESNRVLVSVNERGLPYYRYQNEEAAKRMREMEPEEFAVYEKVEESRDRGLTAIDLKNMLSSIGFTSATLNKVLKRLEKKGIIKKLKSL
jgi:DNA-binding MarR family transcriptional regulator